MRETFEYTDYTSFLNRLNTLSDEKFAKFQKRLIPGEKILGIRTPQLRALAKQIAKSDWRRFLSEAKDDTLEEVTVQGFVIGYAKMDYDEAIKQAAAFVPKIKSWASCDLCGSAFKFLTKNPETSFTFLKSYLTDKNEFAVRFGVTLLMEFFTTEKYVDRLFPLYDGIRHEGYYVKMAVAWAVSACFIKFPERTMAYLKSNGLDDWTFNKALQKITESYRVDTRTKETIRLMKRKSGTKKAGAPA